MERRNDPSERDEQQGRRYEVGEEDPDSELLAPPPREAREAVSCWHGGQQRDEDDERPDKRRIRQPAREQGLPKEQPYVLHGRGQIEQARVVVVVVQVWDALEHRDGHPRE